MSRAFFYKERRLAFVVISLASWFGLLGLIGPYLPANANATNRQITLNMNGNLLTSHWIKRSGRWHFQKISKISKFKGAKSQRTATLKNPQSAKEVRAMERVDVSKAPETTASVTSSTQRRGKKKALRAALADEIGRWAKIGNRWKWQAARKIPKPSRRPAQTKRASQFSAPSPNVGRRQTKVRVGSQLELHWVRKDGGWSFELVQEHTIIRHI